MAMARSTGVMVTPMKDCSKTVSIMVRESLDGARIPNFITKENSSVGKCMVSVSSTIHMASSKVNSASDSSKVRLLLLSATGTATQENSTTPR